MADDPERDALVEAAFSQHESTAEARRHLDRLARFDAVRGGSGGDPEPDRGSSLQPEVARHATVPPLAAAASSARPGPHRGRAVAAAVSVGVGIFVLGAVAGTLSARGGSAATSDASAVASRSREATTTIGRALARPQLAADLPLDYQPGSGTAYPGDSYRLLYDADPTAASAVARWRVWVGQGVVPEQLCLTAAYDESHRINTCYPRARFFDSVFTLTSPTAPLPLSVSVVDGTVSVNGS